MKPIKLALGICAIVAAALVIVFVLRSENALLLHPKGIIARRELEVIVTSVFLMLIVVVPTFICLYTIAWKYRSKNPKAQHEPEHVGSPRSELILWIVPSCVIAALSVFTWFVAHELDPYRPLENGVKPVKIQVIALDWKWLFIYPEHGIATLNFFQFPDNTPVHFSLAADGSPMNSFWVPQLSGQIYCMTGMVTPLHIMADEPGEFRGRAAEINGEGLADMTFIAKASSQTDFEDWVQKVKESPLQLNDTHYNELLERTVNSSVLLYSSVEEGLFDKVVMKYMHPPH